MADMREEALELVESLSGHDLEVDHSNLGKYLYSTDASLYRIPPTAVVFPRDADDVANALGVCRDLNVPVIARGAGTSIAGNAIGPGVIIETSRHMNKLIDIDIDQRTATVEPGMVQAELQRHASAHGLRFGPDPSTSNRCTIGGMIANNACGSRALGYGRTSDNIVELDVVTGAGERFNTRTPTERVRKQLEMLAHENAALIEKNFGTFSRQVSGYALENLEPLDLARLFAGSEGTLGLMTSTTVRLVADDPVRVLTVLGYGSMPDAADAVMDILAFEPVACEGLDARIVDAIRDRHGPARVPVLPRGSGWLFVELTGADLDDVVARANRMVSEANALDSLIVTNAGHAAQLWRIREDGAGLSGRSPAGKPAYAGWEDAAVPPEHLGNYLREFEALMEQHQLTGMPYGHFGDGCVHVRLDFPLTQTGGAEAMRSFLEGASRLVVGYGGSLSGEHGDGRARSELLGNMYDSETLQLFKDVKAVFDPNAILNPGVLVDADKVDSNLRSTTQQPLRRPIRLDLRHDGGDFSAAVHRCTGVGKCRADITGSGGVMCPSYLATREEKDSTRGRARVLQEMLAANPTDPKWRSSEVHEALDLCLMCKGCAKDCPTGVDMGAYKAEVLHQSYKKRLRPRSHYSLGRLPKLAGVASRVPKLANAVTKLPGVASLAKFIAGVDNRRSLPQFAGQTFRQWFENHEPSTGDPVALWVDTFTEYFSPEIGIAAVAVLEDAGFSVQIPSKQLCCGLTWISTGQLDVASAQLTDSLDALEPFASKGIPIVGLEPSCTAVFRSDALELVPGPRAQRVSKAMLTLAELLATTPSWTPPVLDGVDIVAQPHCHHSAVMHWDVDRGLLTKAGASVDQVGGCCGLAGNFGVERGHYETSVKIAEHSLLPAVRQSPDSVVLADGFSCRTQLDDLDGRESLHLAQILAKHLDKRQ